MDSSLDESETEIPTPVPQRSNEQAIQSGRLDQVAPHRAVVEADLEQQRRVQTPKGVTPGLGQSRSKAAKPGTPARKPKRGTLGIHWKDAYRPMVPPTTADTGYRHVVVVHNIYSGGPADQSGRIKVGDKLVAVQEHGKKVKKMVIGMRREELKKILNGEAGSLMVLEFLRATDMGAKKAFTIALTMVERKSSEGQTATTLPEIRAVAQQDSKKKGSHNATRGWAKGMPLMDDLAPADEELDSEEEITKQRQEAVQAHSRAQLDSDVALQMKQLNELRNTHVGNNLTEEEKATVRSLQKQLLELEKEKEGYRRYENLLRKDLEAQQDELARARDFFAELVQRSGKNLPTQYCTHSKHGILHSSKTAIGEGKQILEEFISKIEEAPGLKDLINGERLMEASEQEKRREMIAEWLQEKTKLTEVENWKETTLRKWKDEEDRQSDAAEAVKAKMNNEGSAELADISSEVQTLSSDMENMKAKIVEMEARLEEAKHATEIAEVERDMLELEVNEALGLHGAEHEHKKDQLLKKAVAAAGTSQEALQAAVRDKEIRVRIEQLKEKEQELTAELGKQQDEDARLKKDAKEHRKFKHAVLVAVCGLDPDSVAEEEKRQIAGQVKEKEIVDTVKKYIESQADDQEILLQRIADYVRVRFPFLEMTADRLKLIENTFDEVFADVPPPTEEERADMERKRLENEASEYGYEPSETSGRTAGQLRKMIEDAQNATKMAKDEDRKKRAAKWADDSDDEDGPPKGSDSDSEPMLSDKGEEEGNEDAEEGEDGEDEDEQGAEEEDGEAEDTENKD